MLSYVFAMKSIVFFSASTMFRNFSLIDEILLCKYFLFYGIFEESWEKALDVMKELDLNQVNCLIEAKSNIVSG